jgi:D-alanyl-D-alanine carboxypeptidase
LPLLRSPILSFTAPLRALACGALVALALPLGAPRAAAEALLLVEADSGKVLQAENATYPWYPASVTKLMTTYVTLRAVKERRVTLDTLLTVSANASAQQPSKMGFRIGTQVTVDNALKMMMVKSANDMAVVLAEGVSGSVEDFATEMNRAAQRLGMTQSSFVNPNGLPADDQIVSARDMAILARALIKEFPEYDLYWHIPAIKLGRRVMHNFNSLIDRYPGADGMKTGFICASGYNLVASATRGNRRLIAVVLGASSSTARAEKAAQLLEQGFNTSGLSWLMPSLGTVDALTPIAASPPNLREEICGKNRGRPQSDGPEEEPAQASATGSALDPATAFAGLVQSLRSQGGKPGPLLGPLTPSMPPIPVYVGSARQAAADPAAFLEQPAKPRVRKLGKAAKPGKAEGGAAAKGAAPASAAKAGTAGAAAAAPATPTAKPQR